MRKSILEFKYDEIIKALQSLVRLKMESCAVRAILYRIKSNENSANKGNVFSFNGTHSLAQCNEHLIIFPLVFFLLDANVNADARSSNVSECVMLQKI